VVAQSGRLAPGHEQRQAELLRAEGVTITNGRVRMVKNPRTSSEDT